MVYPVGASCLDKAYNSTSYFFKKTSNKILTHILCLGVCHNNRLKNSFRLLTCGYLKSTSIIIIWHDFINTTKTAHPSHDNTPWSTEQLISTLAFYKDRLAVIIYCKLFGTPDIFKRLLTSGILVIGRHKHLLPTGREITTGI